MISSASSGVFFGPVEGVSDSGQCDPVLPGFRYITQCDADLLLDAQGWLTDSVMRESIEILQASPTSNPFGFELQDTLLQSVGGFKYAIYESPQLLFISGCHWICVFGHRQSVDIYDSLSHGTISPEVRRRCQELFSDKSLQLVPCQQQEGSSDCGLFALAFLERLLQSDNPSQLRFAQNRMRLHLWACLQRKFISRFPLQSEEAPSMSSGILFCICPPLIVV